MSGWLLLPVGLYLGWRLVEYRLHRRWLSRIPLCVHVNGTRGKSQTVELIRNGLQACGMRATGKITGVIPTIIYPDGEREKLFRLGPASIAEQMSVMRRATRLDTEVLVIECNAIAPELQSVSQDRILQAAIGVITNVRADHTDALGQREEDIARALSSTIPAGGTLVTGEVRHAELLRKRAAARGASFITAPSAAAQTAIAGCAVATGIHPDNLAVALTVCDILGTDLKTALQGMLSAPLPSGSWSLIRVRRGGESYHVLNAFSANDPISAEELIRQAVKVLKAEPPLVGVFNHRCDRAFRIQTFEELLERMPLTSLILIGDKIPGWRRRFPGAHLIHGKQTPQHILDRVIDASPPGALIVGLGNIGGPGLELVELLEQIGEPI